jgi:hypothetical protein
MNPTGSIFAVAAGEFTLDIAGAPLLAQGLVFRKPRAVFEEAGANSKAR